MNFTFAGIVASIGVASASLGMVGPLVAYWMEKSGVPAWLNGLGTTIMYSGMLLGTLIFTRILARLGLKGALMLGLALSALANLGYLFNANLYWWFFLRALVGFGASALFVGTEIWINHLSDHGNRSKNLGIYGAALALGFAIGPFGLTLKNLHPYLPIYLATTLMFIPLSILLRVQEPNFQQGFAEQVSFGLLSKLVPLGFLTALIYGTLESDMVGNFPIYGLRSHFTDPQISATLASFTIGGLLLQIPLGMLADRIGRRKVLFGTIVLVACFFSVAEVARMRLPLYWLILLCAGGGVASLYSLGLALIGEHVHQRQMAAANALYTVFYGMGSIIGPSLGSTGIELFGAGSFFYGLAILTAILILPMWRWRTTNQQLVPEEG